MQAHTTVMTVEEGIAAPIGVAPFAIGIFVMHTIAVLTTFVRLGYRYRRGLHWDDFWAFLALIWDLEIGIFFLCVCIADARKISPAGVSFYYWNVYFFNPTELWCARLSIAVTVVRILPPGTTRSITKASCWGFFILWVVVMIQTPFMCGVPIPEIPRCKSLSSAILFVIVNTIGTVWLVLWPAYILLRTRFNVLKSARVRVASIHYRLLLGCFSSSVLLLVANIAHAFYVWDFTSNQINLAITGHLEVALSLILCNVLVLVGPIYRFFVPELPANPSVDAVTTIGSAGRRRGSKKTTTLGSLASTFTRTKDPVEVYSSTQVYTLKEYPTSSSQELDEEKKGRASVDISSLSEKKIGLIPSTPSTDDIV